MVHSGVYGRYPASRRDPPPVCGQTMDSGSFSFHMNVEGSIGTSHGFEVDPHYGLPALSLIHS